jgi:hypothetical protein
MKQILHTCLLSLIFFACKDSTVSEKKSDIEIDFNLNQANRLASLPCKCIEQEYPNKLGQVLGDSSQLKSPKSLHPIFYGCFDWHSSVHGHWLLVYLLKEFPNLKNKTKIESLLDRQLTPEKIEKEIAFFSTTHNESFERTYGWAWIFKLQEELKTWNHPKAKKWSETLKPLTDLLETKLRNFLPKLVYPIRSGEHTNTAFGLSFAFDYASSTNDKKFLIEITKAAKRFYSTDENYAFSYEPSGYDFLSPGLEECNLMRKVLPNNEFINWLKRFHPQLFLKDFNLTVGKIKDRSDGKLVHLDGLNFSRAWNLYQLSTYSPELKHLKKLADTHLSYSLPQIVDGDYMGEHWLASFACYALKNK